MASTGFSWADEVEKEEQHIKNLEKPNKKPNPFGSARPREVILEEKGVDWRKLDQQLHQPSNVRKEKPTKGMLKTVSIIDKRESFLQRSKGNVRDRIGPPMGPPNPQKHNNVTAVPPFMHLPKNAIYPMGVMQRPCFGRSDVGLRPDPRVSFHERHAHELDRECGREDIDHEHIRMKYNLNTREDFRRNHRVSETTELNFVDWEEKNMGLPFRRDYLGEMGMLGQPVGLDVNARRLSHINMDTRRESFGGNYNKTGMDLTSEEGDWHDVDYQHERRNYEAEELRGRSRYDLKMEKANFGGNYNERRVNLTSEEGDWRNANYRCERRNFETEELGGRAQYDLKMEKAKFGGKFRKRSLSSAPAPNHYNQRRRR